MALGAITDIIAAESFAVEILASATATNGIPSGTNGIDMNLFRKLGDYPKVFRIGLLSTAGSAVMSVTAQVWFRYGSIGWFIGWPLASSSTAKHLPVAIPETSADLIAYTEILNYPSGADRMYLEIQAIGGVSTAVTGYAFVGKDCYK